MDLTRTSKYLSLILRHKPETAGIELDEHGWANVDELIAGVSKTHPLNREMLEEIVRTDEKGRYSFNEDRTLIRANQGHSIPVDVELPIQTPPETLYHGTGAKYADSIDAQGSAQEQALCASVAGRGNRQKGRRAAWQPGHLSGGKRSHGG